MFAPHVVIVLWRARDTPWALERPGIACATKECCRDRRSLSRQNGPVARKK